MTTGSARREPGARRRARRPPGDCGRPERSRVAGPRGAERRRREPCSKSTTSGLPKTTRRAPRSSNEQRALAAEMGIHDVDLPHAEPVPNAPAPPSDLDFDFGLDDIKTDAEAAAPASRVRLRRVSAQHLSAEAPPHHSAAPGTSGTDARCTRCPRRIPRRVGPPSASHAQVRTIAQLPRRASERPRRDAPAAQLMRLRSPTRCSTRWPRGSPNVSAPARCATADERCDRNGPRHRARDRVCRPRNAWCATPFGASPKPRSA